MHYTSGTTGQAQGRHDRAVGRGTATSRLRGRGRRLALRPRRPPHGLLADVPHGRPSASPAAPCWRAGRWPSSAASTPPPPSMRCVTTARPPPSSSRPTCERILPVPRPAGTDERFDSLRLLAHAGAPCPEPVKRAVMARVRPRRASGSSTARPRPSSRCARPRTGSSAPAPSAGPARAAASTSPRSPTTSSMTRRRAAPSGATCRPSPASATGTTPPPRPPPGTGRPAPSATSATSIPTTSST